VLPKNVDMTVDAAGLAARATPKNIMFHLRDADHERRRYIGRE